MTEALHAWAVAPAAIGACCLAADRRRVRAPELVASALMLLAMLDAWLTRAVPAVYWSAALLTAAMALSARRRRAGARTAGTDPMRLHMTLGLLAMGMLQLVMSAGGPATVSSHGHGGGPMALVAATAAGALAYLGFSVIVAVRMRARLRRAQVAAMAVAVLVMAGGLAA